MREHGTHVCTAHTAIRYCKYLLVCAPCDVRTLLIFSRFAKRYVNIRVTMIDEPSSDKYKYATLLHTCSSSPFLPRFKFSLLLLFAYLVLTKVMTALSRLSKVPSFVQTVLSAYLISKSLRSWKGPATVARLVVALSLLNTVRTVSQISYRL